MRWPVKTFDPTAWRRTFALFPVETLDGVCVWWEHVETRDVPLPMGRARTIHRLVGSTAEPPPIPQPPPPRVRSVIKKEADHG